MTLGFRNFARGEFGLRRTRGRTFEPALFGLAVGVVVFLGCAQGITQWMAARLLYSQQLGAPLLDLRPSGEPLYGPWQGYSWAGRLERTEAGIALADGVLGAYQLAFWLALAAGALTIGGLKRHLGNRVTDLHGSARWARRDDIEQAGLLAPDGVIVGAWQDPKTKRTTPLRHNGPDHILFFATTGSGKGVGCVLPTLLTWRHSALVLDLKGENFALTSGYRKSLGQNVFKLDFAAPPDQTAHFNLLDFVRFGTLQEDADVQRVCAARIDPTGALRKSHSDGHHWLSTGIGFMAAAVLHSVYSRGPWKGARSPVGLSDVAADLSNPSKTFDALMDEWLHYAHDPSLAHEWRDHEGNETPTHPIVSAVARIQKGRSANERSAIMSTVMTALEVFRDPLLAMNTSTSDFTVDDIMDAERPTSLYFVVRPSDADRLAPVVRLFLDLVIRRLTEQMSFVGGREAGTHRHELLLLLDELPALGKVSVIAEALGYFRGWNIKALVVVQSLMQLREHFGQYESISGLCGVSAAYAPAKVDIETAKHLSSMCGTTTVIRRTAGISMPVSEQELSRPLLTPDEVSSLPGPRREGREVVEPGHMLVFASGCPAIYGQQYLFFKDPVLLARSRIEAAPPLPHERAALRPTARLVPSARPPRLPTTSLKEESHGREAAGNSQTHQEEHEPERH